MRSLAVIICTFAIASAQQPKAWNDAVPAFYGPMTGGWQVGLFSEKPSVFTGEPALVMLVAQNTTSMRLKIGIQKSQWRRAEFAVKRLDNGRLVNLRPISNEFERLRRGAGGIILFEVDPLQLVRPGPVNLQELFDLSPGTYTVTASCKLTDKDTGKTVAVPSNQITISIVQRP